MSIEQIVVSLILGTMLEAAAILQFDYDYAFNIFNPVLNYKRWKKLNWFGVILFTTILNLICPVLSIGFWFFKLCTVGRK